MFSSTDGPASNALRAHKFVYSQGYCSCYGVNQEQPYVDWSTTVLQVDGWSPSKIFA